MKKQLLWSAVLAASVAAAPVWAADAKPDSQPAQSTSQQSKQVQQEVRDLAAEEQDKVLQEAIAAMARTSDAIRALDKGDKDRALNDLATAVGKLELITTAYPEMELAPVDVQVVTSDLAGSVDEIKEAVEKAKDLLDDGRVQDARLILEDLASEVVIRTVNVPLATYPDAIKAVVPLIKEGKFKEAKTALVTALSTLVVVDDVIPLPVLRAEAALAEAKKLAAKKDRSPEEAKQLADLLKQAKEQLAVAEVLGYGEKDVFKPFYADIKAIEKATGGGGTEQTLFDKLKARFEKLKSSF